jgi:hypothetical protein
MATNTTNTHPTTFVKQRKPRKESAYSKEEKSILGKYKDEYKSKTARERQNVLRGSILVDIFNYWQDKGIALDADEMEKRVTV